MRTSAEITEIAQALIGFQASIEAAPKDAENPFFKARYADLATVWGVCRKALGDHGLAVIQSPGFDGGRVTLTTRVVHKSGQWLEGELSMQPMKNDPQAIGSCITYARRYALSAMLGVVTEEDDDGNAATIKMSPNTLPSSKPAARKAPVPYPRPADSYNPDGHMHKHYLFGEMKRLGIESYQAEIATAMVGRPFADLQNVTDSFEENNGST